MVKVFKAREATIKISADITVVTTANLSTFFSGATTFSGAVKNVTITEPEGAVEQIPTHGQDANGFQNAEMDEKNFSNGKIAGTLITDGDEVLEPFAYGTAGVTITGGYKRYQPGQFSTGKTRITTSAIMVDLDDGTKQRIFVLDNIFLTKLGEHKSTGADGHFEQDFEAECLPRDYIMDFKD